MKDVSKPDIGTSSQAHLAAMNAGARWCYYIPAGSNDGHGYVPSLVVEGVDGHVPMAGRGIHAAPWYFGQTYEQALKVCEIANSRRGVSPAEAEAIVSSSMRASLRKSAIKSHGRTR